MCCSNCAGFVENGTILDNDDAQWEKSFNINVCAMARMIKAFLPGMIAGGGGSIINVASVAGSIRWHSQPAASKAPARPP